MTNAVNAIPCDCIITLCSTLVLRVMSQWKRESLELSSVQDTDLGQGEGRMEHMGI